MLQGPSAFCVNCPFGLEGPLWPYWSPEKHQRARGQASFVPVTLQGRADGLSAVTGSWRRRTRISIRLRVSTLPACLPSLRTSPGMISCAAESGRTVVPASCGSDRKTLVTAIALARPRPALSPDKSISRFCDPLMGHFWFGSPARQDARQQPDYEQLRSEQEPTAVAV